jgi:hypothetical protein
MNELRNFGKNDEMCEQVAQSLDDFLGKHIVSLAFAGKDITGMKEARDVFKLWLKALREELAPRKQPPEIKYTQGE